MPFFKGAGCTNILYRYYLVIISYHLICPMSEKYTPANLREAIDDLDEIFRAAAVEGNLEATFAVERKSLVRRSIIPSY